MRQFNLHRRRAMDARYLPHAHTSIHLEPPNDNPPQSHKASALPQPASLQRTHVEMDSAPPPAICGVSVPGIRGSNQGYQHDRILTHVSDQGDLYVVFDGHGTLRYGHQVAEMCKQRFLPLLQASEAWNAAAVKREERDEDLIKDLVRIVGQLEHEADPGSPQTESYPGTTLCAVLIKDGWLYTVNVGDSRAVLAQAALQNGRQHTVLTRPVQLTQDHSCSDPHERKRVEDAGGVVINGRLNGELDMSRTIGDHEFKTYRNHPRFNRRGVAYSDTLLTATPDIHARLITEQDIFVVLATDGLWSNRVRNDMVVLHAEGGMIMKKAAREIAQSLVSVAMEYGSLDNISIVFIPLNKLPEREKRPSWRTRRKTTLTEGLSEVESERQNISVASNGQPRSGLSQSENARRGRRGNGGPAGDGKLIADMTEQIRKRVLVRQAPKRFFWRSNGADRRPDL